MREIIHLFYNVDDPARDVLTQIREALERIGDSARVHVLDVEKSDQYHVVIGAELTRDEAKQYLSDLEDDGE